MKIYTRTGDTGETGLFGGPRVPKDAQRIEAYGTVDELNAMLGLARSAGLPKTVDAIVTTAQNELFELGAELATPPSHGSDAARITAAHVTRIESSIDELEQQLPQLKTFILPGGSQGAATLHVARCVCRRAERASVRLAATEHVSSHVLAYLNRLSDLLFVAARATNQSAGAEETPWQAP